MTLGYRVCIHKLPGEIDQFASRVLCLGDAFLVHALEASAMPASAANGAQDHAESNSQMLMPWACPYKELALKQRPN